MNTTLVFVSCTDKMTGAACRCGGWQGFPRRPSGVKGRSNWMFLAPWKRFVIQA